LLFETLTGRGAFRRDSAAATLSAILEHEPDWASLPDDTPAAIRILLRRALEKELARRLRDVGDARLEIDPHISEFYRWGGKSYALLDRYEEAMEWLRQAVTLSGRHAYAINDLASTLALSGQEDEARELLAELEERRAREWIPSMSLSMLCGALGEIDSALDWLELAHDERDVWVPALGTDPRFDPMREDPRFIEMLARLDLPA
jgi:tetratricopeptide (TPR) repeat protein